MNCEPGKQKGRRFRLSILRPVSGCSSHCHGAVESTSANGLSGRMLAAVQRPGLELELVGALRREREQRQLQAGGEAQSREVIWPAPKRKAASASCDSPQGDGKTCAGLCLCFCTRWLWSWLSDEILETAWTRGGGFVTGLSEIGTAGVGKDKPDVVISRVFESSSSLAGNGSMESPGTGDGVGQSAGSGGMVCPGLLPRNGRPRVWLRHCCQGWPLSNQLPCKAGC